MFRRALSESSDIYLQSHLGLPKEILLYVFSFLSPSTRVNLRAVCSHWNVLVKEGWKSYGTITNSIDFLTLMQDKILRQCVPHVRWFVPDFNELPPGCTVRSPTFSFGDWAFGFTARWHLVLELHKEQCTLRLIPHGFRSSIPCNLYGRLENPSNQAQKALYQLRSADVLPNNEPVELLSFHHEEVSNYRDGFFTPPDFKGVTFVAFALPENKEYVTVFTENDCARHHGTDLLCPTEYTSCFALPSGWASSPDYQDLLRKKMMETTTSKRELDTIRQMEFWRVIMRRNHTFRPVSNLIKVYDKKFYALFAHCLEGVSDANRLCVFLRQYRDQAIHYEGRLFLDPDLTLHQLYQMVHRRLNYQEEDEIMLFEEIHGRRLDRLQSFNQTLRDLDLSNGDVLVTCNSTEYDSLGSHFKSLSYDSPLVTIPPQMWHY
jgi:hypothetical protein